MTASRLPIFSAGRLDVMIETKRLLIRQLTAEDWQPMQAIAADFQESQYAVYDMPLPIEEQEIKALTKVFAETGLFFAVIFDSIMIGYIAFHVENENYDLGYCFHSDYQGLRIRGLHGNDGIYGDGKRCESLYRRYSVEERALLQTAAKARLCLG